MPDTKHQEYLRTSLPTGEIQLQKKKHHAYLDTSVQPFK